MIQARIANRLPKRLQLFFASLSEQFDAPIGEIANSSRELKTICD